MVELKGKYNMAKVFTDNIEEGAITQIIELCNQEFISGSNIRIMPDVHKGAGCTIGTTMTIQDKIVPNLVGVDIGCFTGNTKIPLINGTQKTLKELTDLGESFYVYSMNKNKEITYGEARAIKTRSNANLVKVTISGGEEIVCTPDHKFMLRNGDYKEAKDLVYLDSLMPLYRTYQTRDGYESIIQPNNKILPKNTHKLIYQQCFGKIPKGMIIHHKNGNKFDNTPENLQLLTPSEHSMLHAQEKERIKRLQSDEFKKNRLDKLNENGFYSEKFIDKKKMVGKKNILNYMQNNKESFSKVVKQNALRGSKFFTNKNDDEVMKLKQKLGKIRKILISITKENLEVNFKTYDNHRHKFYNYPKYDKFQKILKDYNLTINEIIENKNLDKKLFNNHKVINVEILNYTQDVYCLNVKEHHNFALSAGVFVHNCGVYTVKLGNIDIDMNKLDKIIRENIPHGQKVHKVSQEKILIEYGIDLTKLKCVKNIDLDRAYKSVGTLGGGNHYLELDKDTQGIIYLSIHTGSRNLGKQVAEYYQNLGIEKLSDNKIEKEIVINKLKDEHREKEIQKQLKKIKPKAINKQLTYIEGEDFKNYIHDMKIVQRYAYINRVSIANKILSLLNYTNKITMFDTIHNYIDTDNMILRKGAISAQKGQLLAIPINMRDGVIIGKGKGNPEWNYSAPHGAGRVMSRRVAKENVDIEEFKNTMKGVYSTCINENTMDESPMAYKPIEDIVDNIKETVDIIEIVKPIYNFKSN